VTVVGSIPEEWEVPTNVRTAWVEMLVQRAAYVAGTLMPKVFPEA
jgi:hypothetical protein